MQTVRIRTSQNIEIEYEVAGLGERILAHVIDSAALLGLGYLLYMIAILLLVGSMKKLDALNDVPVPLIIISIVYSIVVIFYNLVAEIFFNGSSIGKYAMKIKVANLDGSRASVGQYFVRWIFRLLDVTLTAGVCAIISVAVSDKKQRVGDIIAGTTLIKTKARTEFRELYFNAPEDDYQPVFPAVSSLSDKDITLVHDVIMNYRRTGNRNPVYQLAVHAKQHLSLQLPKGMNDLVLLLTIVKDYNYITSRTAV